MLLCNFLFIQLGRTECIADELNPKFKEKITLDYHPFDQQTLIFKVWDIDDWNNDINKADFLGEMTCTLQDLVCAVNFSCSLRYNGDDYGKIYVRMDHGCTQGFSWGSLESLLGASPDFI